MLPPFRGAAYVELQRQTAETDSRHRRQSTCWEPGTRSRTRCPVVDLQLPWSTCNACCPPLATHLESQDPSSSPSPSPSPAPVTQDSSSVQQSPDTSQRSATEKLVSVLWTASRRDLQCDLSEAESSGSSGSSSSSGHEDSTMFLHARLGSSEKIPARRCAGDDPALAMIGWVCRGWPRCQQIHATCAMLHGRRDGESSEARGVHRCFSSQVSLISSRPSPQQESCRLEFACERRQSP